MDSLVLQPIGHIDGTLCVPGSKSISNRALLLSALASGTTRLSNLLPSDDIRHMLAALRILKIPLEVSNDGTEAAVTGAGGPFHLHNTEDIRLDLGNAGTAIRPLCAALTCSVGRGAIILDGEPRMRERPIRDLGDALLQAGAAIEYLEAPGYPPLRVRGPAPHRSQFLVRGDVSSQFLSSILMMLPLLGREAVVEIEGTLVSRPYIDITLRLMETFGVRLETPAPSRFVCPAGSAYQSPGSLPIESDASSATYFLAAAAIKGGTVRVEGIGTHSIQGDARFADVLQEMGALVSYRDDAIEVTRGTLRGIDRDLNAMPDAAMTLAVVALFAEGPTTIRGIGNWAVKETDRLAAMRDELNKLGAQVETGGDYIAIQPPKNWRTAVIETYRDHRMAMSLSLAALGPVPMTILDPGCVSKTFPDYFSRFARICHPGAN